MNPPAAVRVTDPQGVHGTIETAAWPLDGSRAEVPVALEGGRQVRVPVQMLVRDEERRYAVPVALADLELRAGAAPREQPLVLPVIQDARDVRTRRVETGRVRITKVIHEREELVDEPRNYLRQSLQLLVPLLEQVHQRMEALEALKAKDRRGEALAGQTRRPGGAQGRGLPSLP